MKFENYLMEVLKEQFKYVLLDYYNYNENQLDSIDMDENGHMYKDAEFIKTYENEIFNSELMNYIYDFLIQVEKDCDINKLVAFLSSHYFVNHYDNEQDRPILKLLTECNIEELVQLFYENEQFGKSILKSFYSNTAHFDKYYETKNNIKNDGNDKALDKLYELAYPTEDYTIITINQKLRNIICNLYNYYISLGYDDNKALEMTWHYFIDNIDPLNELDEICDDDAQRKNYKKYMLGLIFGDLYENTANTTVEHVEEYSDIFADLFPFTYTIFGRSCIPQDPIVRNKMLKTFIMLQDNPEKRKSNRQRTYAEKREKILKRVNPFYILD